MDSELDSEKHKLLRKYRKKLKQISYLETLTRPLNDEEIQKVLLKDSIQTQLQCLLADIKKYKRNDDHEAFVHQSSSSETNNTMCENEETENYNVEFDYSSSPDILNVTQEEKVEECVSISPQKFETEIEEPIPSKIPRQDIPMESTLNDKRDFCPSTSNIEQCNEPSTSNDLPAGDNSKSKFVEESPSSNKVKPVVKAVKDWWSCAQYGLQELVGHSDIVLDVVITENIIASASRDTLVKIWNIHTGMLEQTLGGHTESVNAVVLLTVEDSAELCRAFHLPSGHHICITGSQDSTIRVWHVESGRELVSQYTFTPVNRLAHAPAAPDCAPISIKTMLFTSVLLGSSSGKLELWDLVERKNLLSSNEYEGAVTDLKVVDIDSIDSTTVRLRLLSCSESSSVKVHDMRVAASEDCETRPRVTLHLLYEAESGSLRRVATGHPVHLGRVYAAASASPSACENSEQDRWLVVGDDGANVKVIDRKKGCVRKIANYIESDIPAQFGCCNSICCVSSSAERRAVMLCTGVDVDTGASFLSLVSISSRQEQIFTCRRVGMFLGRRGSPLSRILAVAAGSTSEHSTAPWLVTGGCELFVWQPLESRADSERYSPSDMCKLRKLSQQQEDEAGADTADSGNTDSSDSEVDSDDTDNEEYSDADGRFEKSSQERRWCVLF